MPPKVHFWRSMCTCLAGGPGRRRSAPAPPPAAARPRRSSRAIVLDHVRLPRASAVPAPPAPPPARALPPLPSTDSVIERGSGVGVSDHADDRHDDQEVQEVVGREDARPEHVGALRRLGAEIAERDHRDDEQPEEPLVDRAVLGRAHARGVEPGHEHQDQDRREHRDHAQQLVGDGAQDRVVGQEVPLRHDVRRRRERVGLDVVVGVAQVVGHVEHEPGEQQHEHATARTRPS